MAHVTIDGRDFNLDKLSGKARQQAININPVDQDIRGLLRIYHTARNAHATALPSVIIFLVT